MVEDSLNIRVVHFAQTATRKRKTMRWLTPFAYCVIVALVGVLLCGTNASAQCASISTLNIKLDMPIAGFGSFESYSNSPANNLVGKYTKPAFYAAVTTNNMFNNLYNASQVQGYDPIAGNILPWQGGCYKINVIPVLRAVPGDIHDDTNLALHTLLAQQLCFSDSTTAPQVIGAIDGTFTNSLLYTTLALNCGAYNISTITNLYNDLPYANKLYYPYSARASVRLDAPNLLLFYLMQLYGWTRVSIISVTNDAIVSLVEILQNEANAVGITLQLLFQAPGGGDCGTNLDAAVENDGRIIFFLGDFADLQNCIYEVVNVRQLLLQNYIMILSFSTYSSGGYNFNTFANNLNGTNATALQGVFALTTPLQFSNIGAMFAGQMTLQEKAFLMPTNAVKAATPTYLVMCDAVTLMNQGIYGMLGNRLRNILPMISASDAAMQPTPPPGNTPAQNAQAVLQAVLAALSLSGTYTPTTGYTFTETPDNSTSTAFIPFASMRYPTADVFTFFSNATGMSMTATALGTLIHDSNGEALVKIGVLNWDGAALTTVGTYDMVYGKFNLQNLNVTFPNPALLNTGINNNIPTDRAPTSNIALNCQQCLVSPVAIDPATTVYSKLFMVTQAYELNIAQDNPQTFTIDSQCDGTAPVNVSLIPIIHELSSMNDRNAPLFLEPGVGSVSIYTPALVSAIKAYYAASQNGNGPAWQRVNQQTAIASFAQLSGLTTPYSIVGVVDGGNSAFNVEFLVNCNNLANNVSAVLRLVIQPLPDIYTPPVAAQDALIALNSFGLGLTSFLIFAVVKHRDERAIFSSSFMFLMVILIGFLLLFTSSLLTILPATQAICQAKMITFHLGFTIALGSIFVKNYRLHRIFNSKNLLNMTISNRTLLSAVLSLLLIDVVVIASWIEISGFDIESATKPHCYTSGAAANAFPGIFALLKGFILFAGIYLTFKVRAVPANFNESRFIAVVIYNTAVLSIVYIVVFFAFNIQPNSLSIFTSVICWIGAFFNMALFYAPKLLALKNLYLKNDSSSGSTRSSRGKKHSKEKDRERDREREKGLGTNNTSTLSQLDPEPIHEEKTSEPPTHRSSGTNMPSVESGPAAADTANKEKHRTVDSVSKRLKGLKGKYLSAVISAKRSNAEHNRLLLRADEVRRLADDFYDELRVLVMDIRLNCERLKKMISTAGSGSEELQEHLVSIKDMLRLIELPIDYIQCDESTQTYTVMESARGNSRRTQLHMTSVGSNVTQVSGNTTATTGNMTNPNIQMGNINSLKREQGSLANLAKSPTRGGSLPSPSLHTHTISPPTGTSAAAPSPSPPLGAINSGGSSGNVIMIERDGIPVPLLPLNQTSSMNQPLSGNDLSMTRSFTPRSGREGREHDKNSGTGDSLGIGVSGSAIGLPPSASPVLAPGNGSPTMPVTVLAGAAARASVRRNVI